MNSVTTSVAPLDSFVITRVVESVRNISGIMCRTFYIIMIFMINVYYDTNFSKKKVASILLHQFFQMAEFICNLCNLTSFISELLQIVYSESV